MHFDQPDSESARDTDLVAARLELYLLLESDPFQSGEPGIHKCGERLGPRNNIVAVKDCRGQCCLALRLEPDDCNQPRL